jgi:hypothetical protein
MKLLGRCVLLTLVIVAIVLTIALILPEGTP